MLKPKDVSHTIGGFVRRLGVVAIVWVGLMAVLAGIAMMSLPVSFFGTSNELDPTPVALYVAMVLPALAAFLFAAILILGRRSISEWLFEDEEIDLAADPARLLGPALAIMGVWIVSASLPELIAQFVILLSNSLQMAASFQEIGGLGGSSLWDYLTQLTAPVLETTIGVILIIRSSQLAGWMSQMQTKPGVGSASVTEGDPDAIGD